MKPSSPSTKNCPHLNATFHPDPFTHSGRRPPRRYPVAYQVPRAITWPRSRTRAGAPGCAWHLRPAGRTTSSGPISATSEGFGALCAGGELGRGSFVGATLSRAGQLLAFIRLSLWRCWARRRPIVGRNFRPVLLLVAMDKDALLPTLGFRHLDPPGTAQTPSRGCRLQPWLDPVGTSG
jgi:hypothetical protein